MRAPRSRRCGCATEICIETVPGTTFARSAVEPYCLLVVGGPLAGRTISLTLGEHVMVSARRQRQVVLEDPTISAKHCVLRVGESAIEIQELRVEERHLDRRSPAGVGTGAAFVGHRRRDRGIAHPDRTAGDGAGSVHHLSRRPADVQSPRTRASEVSERVVVVPEEPREGGGAPIPLDRFRRTVGDRRGYGCCVAKPVVSRCPRPGSCSSRIRSTHPASPSSCASSTCPAVEVPCLFISGTSDPFGTPDELERATATIPGHVEHVWLQGGRHELKGKDAEIAAVVAKWIKSLKSVR